MDPDKAETVDKILREKSTPGFAQRLLFLLIAYGLTTVVGGLLTYYFQERSRYNQFEEASFTSQKAEALALYQEIAELIGERHYIMLRIYFGGRENPFPEDYEERWEKYREVLYIWNKDIWKRRAMLRAYFGEEMQDSFRTLHYKFRDVGVMLEKGKRAGSFQPEELEAITKAQDEITQMIKDFNASSLEAILGGSFGTFRDGVLVQEEKTGEVQ